MAPHERDYAGHLLYGQVMIRGKIDRTPIEGIRDRVLRLPIEHREHAQRPEEYTSVNFVGCARGEKSGAIEGDIRVDHYGGHPVAIGGGLRLRVHADWKTTKTAAVKLEDATLSCDQLVDALRLRKADCRLQIREPVLVSETFRPELPGLSARSAVMTERQHALVA